MKHYTFYRESNNFDDILNDISIKKSVKFKIRWLNHLVLGFGFAPDDKLLGYVVLKFGEDIKKMIEFDYSPIAGKDYVPAKR